MAGGGSGRSFEYTPTWVVAVVCFVIVFISVLAERGLHKLGRVLNLSLSLVLFLCRLFILTFFFFLMNQLFKHKHQDPLLEALQKLKEGWYIK